LVRRSDLKSVQSNRLQVLSTTNTVPAAERAILGEAALRQKEVEEASKETEKVRAEIKKTEKDLERLREHLKALGKDSGAGPEGNPLVKRMLEAEDRLSTAQKRLETLDADQDRRRDAVRKVLERLPKTKDKASGT
jgi:peptidoglycan hydrolase CwlO-like protein